MPMFLRSALSLIESVGWYACAIALESATQSNLAPSGRVASSASRQIGRRGTREELSEEHCCG